MPIDQETRDQIENLYGSGSTGAVRSAGKGSLLGAAMGALGYGLPAAGLLFGLRHLTLKTMRPSKFKDFAGGAMAGGALAGTGAAAYQGVLPGAIFGGVSGAMDPSSARKELFDIARGHGDYTSQERDLARKALKDIAAMEKEPALK
jgi:hypothetical protein